jgi:hypothetical protein
VKRLLSENDGQPDNATGASLPKSPSIPVEAPGGEKDLEERGAVQGQIKPLSHQPFAGEGSTECNALRSAIRTAAENAGCKGEYAEYEWLKDVPRTSMAVELVYALRQHGYSIQRDDALAASIGKEHGTPASASQSAPGGESEIAQIARDAAQEIMANVVPATWEDRNKAEFIYKTVFASIQRILAPGGNTLSLQQFVNRMIEEGGAMVTSDALSPGEIDISRRAGRMFVTPEGFGLHLKPKLWLEQQNERMLSRIAHMALSAPSVTGEEG